jgi:hypothetical protein
MTRSQRRSSGVLGPLGVLMVVALWLITVSGNTPSTNLAAPPPSSQPVLTTEPIAHAGHVSQGPLVPVPPNPIIRAIGA